MESTPKTASTPERFRNPKYNVHTCTDLLNSFTHSRLFSRSFEAKVIISAPRIEFRHRVQGGIDSVHTAAGHERGGWCLAAGS